MPKRKSRKNPLPQFDCPHCHRQLWRVGEPKYFLHQVGVNHNVWLENFFCEEHGKILMSVSVSEPGKLSGRPATEEDWQGIRGHQDKLEP